MTQTNLTITQKYKAKYLYIYINNSCSWGENGRTTWCTCSCPCNQQTSHVREPTNESHKFLEFIVQVRTSPNVNTKRNENFSCGVIKKQSHFLLLQSLWSPSISGESMVRPEGLLSGWDCVRCDWWRYETTLNVWMNGARNERTYVYGNDDDTLFSSCIPSCPVPVWFFSRQKFIGCEHKFIHKTPTIQWIYTRCMDGWLSGWMIFGWVSKTRSIIHARVRIRIVLKL